MDRFATVNAFMLIAGWVPLFSKSQGAWENKDCFLSRLVLTDWSVAKKQKAGKVPSPGGAKGFG